MLYIVLVKTIATVLFFVATLFSSGSSLVNSTWELKVASKCINTFKFKSDGVVLSYDCELNYTMHGVYKFAKDTLIVTEKDDSHPEDGGKAIFYRTKFFARKDVLYPISRGILRHGRWIETKVKFNVADVSSYFKRIR